MSSELGPAERFVAGAVGRPGERVFLVYVAAGGVEHWFVAEKEQVAVLAQRSLEIIEESSLTVDADAVETLLEGLELPEPSTERFRIGTIVLRAAPDRSLVTVRLDSVDEDDAVEFEVAPEQLQAMAIHALAVVGQGRPICPLCRLPMDPDEHRCPALNGHHAD